MAIVLLFGPLSKEIINEVLSHPLLTKEFLYSWFDGFKNFDVNKLENRKMLIDTFVNSVVLYDDRIDFYFNFKDNAKSLTLSELNTVSDLSSSSPPRSASFNKSLPILLITFSLLTLHFSVKFVPPQRVKYLRCEICLLHMKERLLFHLMRSINFHNLRSKLFHCEQGELFR